MACAINTDVGTVVKWTKPAAYQPVLYYDIYRLTADITAAITTSMIVGKVTFATTQFFDVYSAPSSYWYRVKSISWGLKSSTFTPVMSGLISGFYHSATSIVVGGGTSTGTLTDIQTMFDTSFLTVAEVSGTAALSLTINFTANVNSIQSIIFRGYYSGGSTHGVRIQLYNYSKSAFDTIHTLADNRDYESHFKNIISDTNYISSATAIMRMHHTENGIPGHALLVDYIGMKRKTSA